MGRICDPCRFCTTTAVADAVAAGTATGAGAGAKTSAEPEASAEAEARAEATNCRPTTSQRHEGRLDSPRLVSRKITGEGATG
jgi:hypothetical protein